MTTATPTPATSITVSPHLGDSDGISVRSQRWLDDRLVEVTLATDALAEEVGARILVPRGYDPDRSVPYPLIVLLHGGLGDFRSWSDNGAIAELTAAAEVIVVMPHGGTGGWYRDWHAFGRGGTPRWETFHMERFLPWVDRQLHTRSDAAGRAIAGLSMGGYGALKYAARHPGTFGTAASFSGAVNTDEPLVKALICVSSAAHLRLPFAINRFPVIGDADWQEHNPWHLAERLRGLHLTITTGNGRPTRFARRLDPRPKDLQEHQVRRMTRSLHRRLDALGIDHTYIDYGNVGHVWANWIPATTDWLDQVLPRLTAPVGTVSADASSR